MNRLGEILIHNGSTGLAAGCLLPSFHPCLSAFIRGSNSFLTVAFRPSLLLACACASLHAAPLPDISTVPADLSIPQLSDGPPAAGKRVSLELFEGTPPVILYLPTDWAQGKKFPVIIELAGNGNFKNSYGDTSSGLPEGSKLGYGLSGGKGYIWACVPFLNEAGDKPAISWWGTPRITDPTAPSPSSSAPSPPSANAFSATPNA